MEKLFRLLRCWGLAATCFMAPILFGLIMMEYLSRQTLGIDIGTIDWTPTIIEPAANPKREAKPQPALVRQQAQPVAAERDRPVPEQQGKAAQDLTIRPLVIQLVGRQNHIAVSGFHIVACVAAIMIAVYVLLQFCSFWVLIPIALVCAGVAWEVGHKDWGNETVREKFVFSVFRNAAFKDAYLQSDTSADATRQENSKSAVAQPVARRFDGKSLVAAVGRNTLIGLFSAGFVLFALLTVSKLPDEAPSPKELHDNAKYLRLLLYAASAGFVTSIISSKVYVDLPPRLVEPPSDAALKEILVSLLSVWGATFSIVLITGFGPAFAVWLLRREKFRALVEDERKRLLAATGQKEDDSLNILPMSTLTSILSVVAPLFASPVFEALQKLLAAAAAGAK